MNEQMKGLSQVEVEERIRAGKQNDYEENISKTNKEIIYDNVFTLFNLLNVLIALCLAFVGAFSNMFFLAIIIINVMIGIIQEIRAKNLVAKLSIVAKEQVSVIREGKETAIDATQLVLDDLVILQAGQQVPSDMTVVSGKAEVNEALLTGESDLIEKESGSSILSGSYLASGRLYAQVTHVGKDNYAVRIANEAKTHKPIQSELIDSIRKVSKFTSYVIIPLGIILFIEAFFVRQSGPKEAVVSSAAALLGMLPKGLVLLISIALATAVTKLAKKRILVQSMYSVETLAHVDTLCLDKTGTITEGKMKVQKTEIVDAAYEQQFSSLIGSYLYASEDNNITMQALRQAYPAKETFAAQDILPFSSERKWGAMYLKGVGTVVLGAPEKLMPAASLPQAIIDAQAEGYRVLLLARSEKKIVDQTLPKLDPVAIFEINDPIRKNAEQTLSYLKAEGIDLKVISGDNPVTVSNIARKAGLPGYESYIDLSTLTTDEEVRQAVSQYTVFGRVTPQQKKLLVQELKVQGHVVAMTGDGVNDVLALREADCSIAMAEGDSATRQISNLVLLDSDFTSLPDVLFEGRRVVNNVTKVAGVFFIKTIYSFILSILCGLTTIAFPFAPIQITLIDLAIEGYPIFFLSFEENKRKVTGEFLPTALRRAFPNAMLVLFNIIVVYVYAQITNLPTIDMVTLMYYLLAGVSIMALIQACLPFNPLRVFLAVTTTVGFYIAAMLFHSILEIHFLTATTLPMFVVLIVISGVIRILISKVFEKKTERSFSAR